MLDVLVVDDEADVQFLFKQYFRRAIRRGEIAFRFAFSGEEALAILAHRVPRVVLVLSDINMPGMTGLELLQRIKAAYPGTQVVMITAYGDAENRSQALDYGADGYLTKPIDFEALREMMHAIQHSTSWLSPPPPRQPDLPGGRAGLA